MSVSVGDKVAIKPEMMHRFSGPMQKKLTNRTGIIEIIYQRPLFLSSKAKVLWHKRGNRGKEFLLDVWFDEIYRVDE